MEPIKTVTLADGVRFHTIYDDRFKRCRITIALLTELDKNTVSDNAMLFGLLKNATAKTPSFTEIGKKLAALYGAGMSDAVSKFGSCQLISLGAGGMADKYALGAECISGELASLLCEVAFDPYTEENGDFSHKYTALEKERLLDDIRSVINDKRGYALSRAMELIARGEPFGLSRLGDLKTAQGITPASQKKAYEKLLQTAQIEILCIGNGDFDAVRETFAHALQGLKRDYIPVGAHQPIKRVDEVQRVCEVMPISQAKMVMAFSADTPETDELLPAMRLMNAMLGGTVTSKLFVHVREEKSLCYYCASRYDRIKSLLLIDSGVQQQNLDVAYEAIMEQIAAMQAGDFTDEEIEAARLAMINSYRSVLDSPGAMESWYLGQLLSGRMYTPLQEIENIQNVTREQIVKAANRLQLDTVYRLECEKGAEAIDDADEYEEEE